MERLDVRTMEIGSNFSFSTITVRKQFLLVVQQFLTGLS